MNTWRQILSWEVKVEDKSPTVEDFRISINAEEYRDNEGDFDYRKIGRIYPRLKTELENKVKEILQQDFLLVKVILSSEYIPDDIDYTIIYFGKFKGPKYLVKKLFSVSQDLWQKVK